MPDFPRFEVAGVKIDAVTLRDTVDLMHAWIRAGRREYIVLTGAHGVVEMQTDVELREINNRAGLTTPDGMSVVWLGRAHGFREIEKVYAPDIMNLEFSIGVERGHRHFLYGGKPGVVEKLIRRLKGRLPGIQIAGSYCPPFRPLSAAEEADVVERIQVSSADIVWCGLGCPKQEKWMAHFRPLLQAPILIGVGAGFDFLAGEKPLAPEWIKHSGFEWAYRTLSEPSRLGPRYARVVPSFLYHVARSELGRVLRRA
ncbi:MAG TPA: WecB/TagA/CpsF family glycosyltransferase [Polyangiales bacterium]|nr:WecB/TagA/CpsF family glycosyltransferase [Polyangiales bacterium]